MYHCIVQPQAHRAARLLNAQADGPAVRRHWLRVSGRFEQSPFCPAKPWRTICPENGQ